MHQHAFVAMPFGSKAGPHGKPIHFDRVYLELIRPALEQAGLTAFRADQELRAGDIRPDMFQELLVADLVIADVSIDNPNVWYELGVRHALRARGVIQICASVRGHMPFDLSTDRALVYRLLDGAPDPDSVERERTILKDMTLATLKAWHGRMVSPVYNLLPDLPEPDWRRLLLEGHNEFRDALETWGRRVEVARRKSRPGDILVLADETPTQALQLEARRQAGRALARLGQFGYALEQYEQVLNVDPADLDSRQQKAVLLGRLGKREEARAQIQALLEDHPADAETLALLGRVEKEEWISRWRVPGTSSAQMRLAAAGENALLMRAIEPYTDAFVHDPGHCYSGINALTLRCLALHLGDDAASGLGLADLRGGALWACLTAMRREPKDYWSRASLAELSVLFSDTDRVVRDCANATAAASGDWFALDSICQQLLLLKDLEFRPEQVAAALNLLDKELARAQAPLRPRRVVLFSGHMIDAPGRNPPRFPPEQEATAAAAIAAGIDELGVTEGDLAICGGACGGDTLFAEACLARGARLQIHIQSLEPKFIAASVAYAGPAWVERYRALKARATLLVQPSELGPAPEGVDVFERNNLWQLYTALSYAAEQVRFLCLWNGKGSDGPGGTRHMYEEVKRRTGEARWLDTTRLW